MWDVFICHAWEDKETIARPLAYALMKAGLKVWYDELTLRLGDSLRRSIDRGLSQSKYGIVILSPHFFSKEWPQRELDGLVAREIHSGKVILPVWHKVTGKDVEKFSPVLADKLSVSTASGLDIVVQEIIRVVHPQSSENVYPKRRVPVYKDEYESVRQEKAKNLQEQEFMSSRFMIATDSNLEEILREHDAVAVLFWNRHDKYRAMLYKKKFEGWRPLEGQAGKLASRVAFATLDVAKNPESSAKYPVGVVYCFIFFYKGKPYKRISLEQTPQQIEQAILKSLAYAEKYAEKKKKNFFDKIADWIFDFNNYPHITDYPPK